MIFILLLSRSPIKYFYYRFNRLNSASELTSFPQGKKWFVASYPVSRTSWIKGLKDLGPTAQQLSSPSHRSCCLGTGSTKLRVSEPEPSAHFSGLSFQKQYILKFKIYIPFLLWDSLDLVTKNYNEKHKLKQVMLLTLQLSSCYLDYVAVGFNFNFDPLTNDHRKQKE